jgi:hypothetical protein
MRDKAQQANSILGMLKQTGVMPGQAQKAA